jgi:hypothetical protein
LWLAQQEAPSAHAAAFETQQLALGWFWLESCATCCA